jgi:hypothetical protein
VQGPALYLRFDESSGNSAYDSSGFGYTGSLVNGPAWVSGRNANGLQFDGVNDYVTMNEFPDIYDRITLSAWIKPSTVSRDQDIVSRARQTSYTGYEFGLTSAGELFFRINPTSSSYAFRTSSGAAIAANIWQHIAVTYDGTNIRFYKNGALISTVAAGGRLYPTSSSLFIGIYESEEDNQYGGVIDELRIYNRQLSSSELNQLYSSIQGVTTTTTTPTTTSTTARTTTSTTVSTTTRATTTTTTTTRTTTTTTTSTTTTTQPTCRVGSGYTFSGVGSYTASSSSGVPSISRSGQYTFYETPHNYANDLSCQWSGTYTCPTGTNIRFYLRAQTEAGYDYFSIKNSAGTAYEEINGDYGTAYSWTSTYNQRTAAFNFVSDEGVTNWGIDLYRIECITPTTTTTTTQSTTSTTRASTTTTTTISSNALDLIAYGIKGDGSDETAKLQSAFDYAASNGYKVVSFPAGKTIGVSDTITFPGNMEYNGNGCTLYLLDDSYIIAESYYTFNYYTGDNVYIHHLIFDGNMNRQYRPTPPSGYYFPLRPNGGIVMYNNARFEYNEVRNYGGYMVEISHGDNAIISHNLIHDGWQYGICTAGTDSDYSNNAVVTDNVIYRMGQVGIKIQHTSNSLFEGNTITIPGRYDLFSVPSIGSPEPTGIRLYSFDGPNNHVTITGNTITGSGGNNEIAIQSDDSSNTYITITNNQIRNAYTGINIKFNNGVITGNTISYVGTCIANSGSGNTVSGNTCT